MSFDLSVSLHLLALNEAKVEIRIQFKDVSQGIFKDITRNELVIRIFGDQLEDAWIVIPTPEPICRS